LVASAGCAMNNKGNLIGLGLLIGVLVALAYAMH
jgi:hypothetical protein